MLIKRIAIKRKMKVAPIFLCAFYLMPFSFAQSPPVLFPVPQNISYQQGELSLTGISVYMPANVPPDVAFALNELKQAISLRSGKAVKRASTASLASISYNVKNKGSELPGIDEWHNGNEREQYDITITAKKIHITANTSAGLYYAVQTIRQLLSGSGDKAVLPFVTIQDKPALAYRGVMMDFAHGGLLTVDEIKKQIDFLALWKANQYYFYNEVSIELKGYPTLNYQAGYTKEQVGSIIAYGRRKHIDVIPFLNLYGHLHELIRNEKYADLAIGKYGHELDPRNPKVNELLKDWIKQYAELFPSPFMHVGFDETWETKRIAPDADKKVDPEALWLQQLDMVNSECKKYGKKILAWTDMNNFYTDIITKIPKDVTPVIWEYSPDTAAINHFLQPVLKEGFPFFIQPAVCGWGYIYPLSQYTFDNIDLCLKAGMANRTEGFITSVWTDAVEPFIRPSWMFMAYGCIGSWQGTSPDSKSFTDQYASVMFPSVVSSMQKGMSEISAAGDYLKKCLGKNTSNMPGGTVVESWLNPFTEYYLTNTNEHIEDFRMARKMSEAAMGSFMEALRGCSKDDRNMINSLLVSARLINYSATRFIWSKKICDRWNEAMLEKKKNEYVFYDLSYSCHGLLVDVMNETGELKDAYAKAWLTESMPYRLNTMLGRFDVEYGLWQKLSLKILDYRIRHSADYVADKSFQEIFKPDF